MEMEKPKRRGKYTPEERERVRRERNRMHAKRTRDRKKMFLEESEQLIKRMKSDNGSMRKFLDLCGVDTNSISNAGFLGEPLSPTTGAFQRELPQSPQQPQEQQQRPLPPPGNQVTEMYSEVNMSNELASSNEGTTLDGGDSDDSLSTAGAASPKR